MLLVLSAPASLVSKMKGGAEPSMPTSVWTATLYLPTLPRQYFLLKMHMHDFKRQSPHQSLTTQPSHSPLQGRTERNAVSSVVRL